MTAGWSPIGAGALLAGLGVAVLLWPSPHLTADVGTVRAAAGSTEVGPPAVDAPAADSRAARPPAATTPGATAASPAPPAPAPGQLPERLVLAAVGIDAPLLATSVGSDGALVPPDDPAELGWWRGVRPGAGAGSVLITGHVDAKHYGQGPLASLVELAAGDRATVTGADGASTTYALRGVQTFAKDALPADELFGHDGPERLVLVTCGGTFDPERGGWDSNIVAVLDPVPAPSDRRATGTP